MKKLIGQGILLIGLLVGINQPSVFAGIQEEAVIVSGRVYVDLNENGQYDEGEIGVPGVKIMTSQGEVVTTDTYGRYHIIISGQPKGGYMLKLDKKSLASGYVIVTENPKVIRISGESSNQVDFGVVSKRKRPDRPQDEPVAISFIR